MALGINYIWECRVTATAANVNGAGFNPESATLGITDLTTDAATGNTATPVVSSATYNFVAGDVGHYVFIQAGTNWFPGWYLITSVAANKATLSAATGAMIWYTSGVARTYAVSTSPGVASVATPTAGTATIDYTQNDTAGFALSGLTSAGAGNVVLSAASVVTMIGNTAKVVSGTNFTVGWFEVTAVTAGVSFTCSTNQAGTAISTGVGAIGVINIGGAASLQSAAAATDDLLFENSIGTNGTGAHNWFIKTGNYAAMSAVSLTAIGTARSPVAIYGYNSLRTDGFAADLGSNKPILNFAANTCVFTTGWDIANIYFTGTAATLVTIGNQTRLRMCKTMNSSVTGSRTSCDVSAANSRGTLLACESVSLRGHAFHLSSATASMYVTGCYFHHSRNGILTASTAATQSVVSTILAYNWINAYNIGTANTGFNSMFQNNTFYGGVTALGVGIIAVTGSSYISTRNCIFFGLVTPINNADSFTSSNGANFNDYFSNTNGNTNQPLGKNDLALNPQFANTVERTGTTATTTAGNHLVQAGATFVTWGITTSDILYIASGTGAVQSCYSILSIDSETQITVGETLVADATADKTWFIAQGHNFLPKNPLVQKGGYPGVFPGGFTTGFMPNGAVAAQASGNKYIIGG